MRAVGARAHKNGPPSENWIRDEWTLAERTSYSGNDFSETTATLFKEATSHSRRSSWPPMPLYPRGEDSLPGGSR